jgi:hypothetical protein
MTPRGHFTSLARQCRHAAKWKDMKRLQGYLASPKFIAALNAQEEAVRRIAIRVMTEALADCARKKPVHWAPPPRKHIRWNDATKARFRRVLFREGIEAAAQAVGITVKAARLAAKRHAPDYVVPTTGYHRQAA